MQWKRKELERDAAYQPPQSKRPKDASAQLPEIPDPACARCSKTAEKLGQPLLVAPCYDHYCKPCVRLSFRDVLEGSKRAECDSCEDEIAGWLFDTSNTHFFALEKEGLGQDYNYFCSSCSEKISYIRPLFLGRCLHLTCYACAAKHYDKLNRHVCLTCDVNTDLLRWVGEYHTRYPSRVAEFRKSIEYRPPRCDNRHRATRDSTDSYRHKHHYAFLVRSSHIG